MNSKKEKHPINFDKQELKQYQPVGYLKNFPTLFDENQINVKHHKLILCILDAKGKVISHKKYAPHFLSWLREKSVQFVSFKHKQNYTIVLRNINVKRILPFESHNII